MERGEAIYDGNPCKRGHAARRYVSNWGCVECESVRARDYAAEWVARKKRAWKKGRAR